MLTIKERVVISILAVAIIMLFYIAFGFKLETSNVVGMCGGAFGYQIVDYFIQKRKNK